jgi:hypothetical protein
MTFAINDRVELLNDQGVRHYRAGAICTVTDAGRSMLTIVADDDPSVEGIPVFPSSVIHVTNVPAVRSMIDKLQGNLATLAYGSSAAPSTTSVVDRPAHYTKWAIEPITFIMRNEMEFWRGNIIKYTARAGAKQYDGMDLVESEITDLEKVRRYAEMRINELKGCDAL